MTKLIQKGTISSKIAKQVFQELLKHGGDPETIVRERGWIQISDEGELREIVRSVIEAISNRLWISKMEKIGPLGLWLDK